MCLCVCYAESFVLSSVLSNLYLQLCGAVFFLIHVSLVLCHMYPHLVFVLVFVFKYPLAKVKVHLFHTCTAAD